MASKSRKLVFNDITMKKLSGLLPAKNSYVVNVTPSIYDDVEEQYRPIFTLKPLNNSEMQNIGEMSQEPEKNEENFMKVLRSHIVSFSNVIDISTGEEIKFEADSDGGITDDLFKIIPKMVQAALVHELVNISGFKNY